jgi:hypothetical protein
VNSSRAFIPAVFIPLATADNLTLAVFGFVIVRAYAYLRAKDFKHFYVFRSTLARACIRSTGVFADYEFYDYPVLAFLPARKLS